jgi:hypothetical protein
VLGFPFGSPKPALAALRSRVLGFAYMECQESMIGMIGLGRHGSRARTF